MKNFIIALRVTLVTLVVTGILYPLAVTGLGQAIFPAQAAGSLVKNAKGDVVGSSLIGQSFSWPAYFHPRPSAAGNGYDPTSSGGSNLGPLSSDLRDRMEGKDGKPGDVGNLMADNPDAKGPIPDNLVTASASGLDPHITPEGARYQVPRVATARNVAPERIMTVVEAHIQGRELGFLGEPRVNVLELNLALDKQFGEPPAPPPAPATPPAPTAGAPESPPAPAAGTPAATSDAGTATPAAASDAGVAAPAASADGGAAAPPAAATDAGTPPK